MSQPLAVALWTAVGAALLALVLTGRGRAATRAGGGGVGDLPVPPAEPGPDIASAEGTYLASAFADRPGARIPGSLGDPSPATLSVRGDGLRITRQGTDDLYVPAAALRAANLAAGFAGKALGPGRVLLVHWAAPATGTLLDTGFQPRHHGDASALRDAVAALVPTPETR